MTTMQDVTGQGGPFDCSWPLGMVSSLTAAIERTGGTVHRAPARPSTERGEGESGTSEPFATHPFEPSWTGMVCGRMVMRDGGGDECGLRADQHPRPRRMVAVTVALSEPADSAPLDWAATVASFLRLALKDTTVGIIETWRADQ